MAATTILFDFTLGAERTGDLEQRKEIIKKIHAEVAHVVPQLAVKYDMPTADGSYCVLSDADGRTLINCRIYGAEGLVTVGVEFYVPAGEVPVVSYDAARQLEAQLGKQLMAKKAQVLPPLKRGDLPRYFPSAGEGIIEYDVDKLLFEQHSPWQKVQILHSNRVGNMLVLDQLQNIAESDLIYTETLMGRGKENYAGKEICILGGGDGALLYELLKEKPKWVVMLEIDELVMQACNQHMRSICGDVLERRKGENYEIIVADCLEYMKRYIAEGRKFDYIFGDLTDIPIAGGEPVGEVWDFMRTIWHHSFQILKPDGKFLTHGNGVSCPESLKMFEEQLKQLKPAVKYTSSKAFVPSFMEDWVFYQVSFAE